MVLNGTFINEENEETVVEEISEAIINELKENEANIHDILHMNKNYHEEKVLTTLKWMLDNNIARQDEEGMLKLFM